MPMRYGDLIQFEPIESVIQLLDANRPDEAKKLVSTYVISDDMAERIAKQMIPQISFDESVDHKGVMVVGNYGTGKSHLMSVLSLVAEDAAYVPMIRHPKVAEAAAPIAGKFKVHRIEISSQMSLRDIITQQLEIFLEKTWRQLLFPTSQQGGQQQGSLRGDDGRLRREFTEPRRAAGRRRVPGFSAVPEGPRSGPGSVVPARDRRGHQAPAVPLRGGRAGSHLRQHAGFNTWPIACVA